MAISTRQVKNKRDSNGVLTGRPGTVYDVNIKYTAPNGEKKTYSKKGFPTKKEATQHEAEMKAKLHNPGQIASIASQRKQTVASYLNEWVESYKAARHMALRHKSKRKPLFSLDELTGEPDGRLLAVEVIRTEERNRILHFCMDEMNPDYREVLYLTYFEDMSYAQAAEVTGKTVKQITNMVYRGKESLRRLLEREGITNAES